MVLLSEMDIESTKRIYNRIQQFEPELVTKFIGYFLLQSRSSEELAQLAYGPDSLIQELINKAKVNIQQLNNSTALSPMSHSLNVDNISVSDISALQFSPLSRLSLPASASQLINSNGLDCMTSSFSNPVDQLHNQTHVSGKYNQEDIISSGMSRFQYRNAVLSNYHMGAEHGFPGVPGFPIKICHFYSKGICKHGSNCRYFHGDVITDNVFGPYRTGSANQDQVISPRSLQELEFEIVEILKSRKGNPVSIASLPMVYYAKYGKNLQAEGYLTESQRHGKAGYNLTRLLARLRNSIRLIDRPHGQHAIILAEDAPNYSENRYNRNGPGPVISGSRQLYLTFLAESKFNEDDVSKYFSNFGQVEDVRIPCQQERMFGFVTFASADTVKTILAKGNPHFVSGFRILVKPYKEKAKPLERKYRERRDSLPYQLEYYSAIDSDYRSTTRGHEAPRILKKQLMEEQERAFEFERRHIARWNLEQKTLANQSHSGYSMDGPNFPEENEDQLNSSLTEQFSYILDVLDDGASGDDKEGQTDNDSTPECQTLDLPENQFASTAASSSSISSDIQIGPAPSNLVGSIETDG